jgi:hypothetical protein
MKAIPLTGGYEAQVKDEDYPRLSKMRYFIVTIRDQWTMEENLLLKGGEIPKNLKGMRMAGKWPEPLTVQ